MCIFGLSFVLFIKKLSVGKAFKLVTHRFMHKNRKHAKELEASNLKRETIL